MVPQEGAGGGTPRPRKLMPASMVITTGMSMQAMMSTGPMMLGRMWTASTRTIPAPTARVASTNSALRSAIVWVRTIRP